MKRHGMHLPLLSVIHRLSYPAMVVYYGTLKKKIQTTSYLFWLATHDLYRHNEGLEILPHRVNTILARPYFLLLDNFLNTNRMML